MSDEGQDLPLLDSDSLEAVIGTDEDAKELLSQLTTLFAEDSPKHLKGIDEGISQGDCQKLEAAAHTLKGSCGNLGALRMQHVCQELVKKARSGNLEGALELAKALVAQYEETSRLLQAKAEGKG